jgi:hypothetical protein
MTEKTDDRFVRIPEDLYRQLRKIAASEDRSIASTLRVIVREALMQRVVR